MIVMKVVKKSKKPKLRAKVFGTDCRAIYRILQEIK